MTVINPEALRQELQQRMLGALPLPQEALRPELRQYAELLRDYPLRGGKMLRGMLLVYSALAHGGSLEAALRVASALELFQNWVLIHDDIEDESEERRGRPALHLLYGMPLALNAGDALHARMWAMLVQAALPLEVLQEFAYLVEHTAQGQHLEINWMQEQRFDLSEDDYLLMCGQKAAYYTAVAPLKLGALVAQVSPPAAYTEAGMQLGIGFQIIDDVLNLAGDASKYGKEIAGDLWEGKRTLILLHYLNQASAPERERAQALLRIPRLQKEAAEVAWLHQRLLQSGAVAHAQAQAELRLHQGLQQLRPWLQSLPGQPAAAVLLSILEQLVKRES